MNPQRILQRNLQKIRLEKGINQEQIANYLNLTVDDIDKWEKGKSNISQDRLKEIIKAYGLDLYQFEPMIVEGREYYQLPILGTIACGLPTFAQEDIQGYKIAPENYQNKTRLKGVYFYLVAKGDSMKDVGIKEGDYLLMKQQSSLDSGEIGAFLFEDSNEVNLKIYDPRPEEDSVHLRSANIKYDDLVFTNGDKVKINIFAKLVQVEHRDYTLDELYKSL